MLELMSEGGSFIAKPTIESSFSVAAKVAGPEKPRKTAVSLSRWARL